MWTYPLLLLDVDVVGDSHSIVEESIWGQHVVSVDISSFLQSVPF